MANTGNHYLSPNGANFSMSSAFQDYLPVLTGQTDNPVATFISQIGRFAIIGETCFFDVTLVSTTMTKTTLTDTVSVSLPIAAATTANRVQQGIARVENATAVANMIKYEIASAASTMQFRNYTLAASSSPLTYAVTTPGIGVLTNTITIQAQGSYEIANF